MGPLIIYVVKKDNPFVRRHAAEALNFNISITVYAIGDRKSTRLNSSHTEICALPLHDALPIYGPAHHLRRQEGQPVRAPPRRRGAELQHLDHRLRDRRSEEHTSELQSHRDLRSSPTRRSSDLWARSSSTSSRRTTRSCAATPPRR